MEMTKAQKTNDLKKFGTCVRPYFSRKDPGEFKAVCPGCGKEISTTRDDLSGVEVSVTKRGTATFWHKGCSLQKVWDGWIR